LRSGAVVWWYISQTHTTLSVLGWLEQERQTARAVVEVSAAAAAKAAAS